jgi:hypothetical protein
MICSSLKRLFFMLPSSQVIYERTPDSNGRDFRGHVRVRVPVVEWVEDCCPWAPVYPTHDDEAVMNGAPAVGLYYVVDTKHPYYQ